MPAPLVKSLATQSGQSVKSVETKWNKAKNLAKQMGKAGEYDYIVGILKNMLDINESVEDFMTAKFLESGHTNFDTFLNEMISGGITSGPISVSGDIPQELVPEQPKKTKKPERSADIPAIIQTRVFFR